MSNDGKMSLSSSSSSMGFIFINNNYIVLLKTQLVSVRKVRLVLGQLTEKCPFSGGNEIQFVFRLAVKHLHLEAEFKVAYNH